MPRMFIFIYFMLILYSFFILLVNTISSLNFSAMRWLDLEFFPLLYWFVICYYILALSRAFSVIFQYYIMVQLLENGNIYYTNVFVILWCINGHFDMSSLFSINLAYYFSLTESLCILVRRLMFGARLSFNSILP